MSNVKKQQEGAAVKAVVEDVKAVVANEVKVDSGVNQFKDLSQIDDVLKRRFEVDSLIKSLSAERDGLDTQIKNELGTDYHYGKGTSFEVSFTESSQQRLDTKKMKSLYADVYTECLHDVPVRRFVVKAL